MQLRCEVETELLEEAERAHRNEQQERYKSELAGQVVSVNFTRGNEEGTFINNANEADLVKIEKLRALCERVISEFRLIEEEEEEEKEQQADMKVEEAELEKSETETVASIGSDDGGCGGASTVYSSFWNHAKKAHKKPQSSADELMSRVKEVKEKQLALQIYLQDRLRMKI